MSLADTVPFHRVQMQEGRALARRQSSVSFFPLPSPESFASCLGSLQQQMPQPGEVASPSTSVPSSNWHRHL